MDCTNTSDTSSIDSKLITREQIQKQIDSLIHQSIVLEVQSEGLGLNINKMVKESKQLEETLYYIQELEKQDKDLFTNTFLEQMKALKNEKETLAIRYEQEEEFLKNSLSQTFVQLHQEKLELGIQPEDSHIMQKIRKLEAKTFTDQTTLKKIRHDKVFFTNKFQQVQEYLANKLNTSTDKIESEKRQLQIKLDKLVSDLVLTTDQILPNKGEMAKHPSVYLQHLREKVNIRSKKLHVPIKEYENQLQKNLEQIVQLSQLQALYIQIFNALPESERSKLMSLSSGSTGTRSNKYYRLRKNNYK